MKKIFIMLILGVIMFSFFAPKRSLAAESSKVIELVSIDKEGGMPLMQALNDRKSSRSFEKHMLSDEHLSGLLWSAWGYNRPDKKKRTAPSSMNKQEISIYCALENGLYLYNAEKHQLELILDKDLRSVTGKQTFVNSAPVNLIYVADTKKQSSSNSSFANVGFISQNVYLYCASEGLGTVVRGWFDANKLHKAMGLKEKQSIILCQTVGYPQK